jgi:hypothetical protein
MTKRARCRAHCAAWSLVALLTVPDLAAQVWPGRVDTLPTGTVVVSNAASGLWGPARPWRVVEHLRIGSVDGNDAAAFGRIASIAADQAGRLYVLDRQAQEVRVFDSTGRHAFTVGRKGGGPGEFTGADGIWVDDSLRLWVSDPRSLRLSVFDSTGRLLRDHPRTPRSGTVPRFLGGEADGAIWDSWGLPSADPERERLETVRLVAGVSRDTVRLPEFWAPAWRAVRRQGSSTMIFNLPVPFGPEQLVVVDPRGGLWRCISTDYRLTRLTHAGDSVAVVTRPHRPVPVSDRERERVTARYRRDFPDPDARMDASLVPAVRPALRMFLADDRGYLWVAPQSADDSAAIAFDVFDPGGRYLGPVPAPVTSRQLRPRPVVRGNFMFYVVTDELDVQYVVRGRIAGRD